MARYFRILSLATMVGAITFLLGCGQSATVKPFSLTIWGVTESHGEFSPLITAMTKAHPGVAINYQQKSTATYRQELLEALAAGKGPDIFAMPAGEVKRWLPLIQSIPSQYTLPIKQIKNTLLQQQEVTTAQNYTALTINQLNKNFVKTVPDDVVVNGKIYGLPLTVDTLILAYNQSLLDAARLPQPPSDWTAFKDAVIRLTKRNPNDGSFRQYGVAMGTGANIPTATDILMLIMMQNGVNLPQNSAPNFGTGNADEGSAAAEAMQFYTDFAQPTKETYSWNMQQPGSLEVLANGRAAMAFLTPTMIGQLRQQQPNLPLVMAAAPQLNDESNPITLADYWVYGVAKNSAHGQQAWGILQEMATNDEALKSLIKNNKRGPSLRSLASALQQDDDPEIVALANQSLVARSWYHGFDLNSANQSVIKIIDAINKNEKTVLTGLADLTKLLQLTYQSTY